MTKTRSKKQRKCKYNKARKMTVAFHVYPNPITYSLNGEHKKGWGGGVSMRNLPS